MRIEVNQAQALAIDIQKKLFPHMYEKDIFLQKTLKLIQGLKLLHVPCILNEQYPKGLGQTIEPIRNLLKDEIAHEKVTFSCCKTDETLQCIKDNNKKFVIVFGIEAHVCVLQSVIDLIEIGFIPILVVDCISSRNLEDKEIAIQRMQNEGAILSTYESLLFELCMSAKNSVFKDISKLVK